MCRSPICGLVRTSRQVDECPLDLEVGRDPRLPLERAVELGQANDCIVEPLVREPLSLSHELLGAEGMELQALCRFLRADARGREAPERAEPARMAPERSGEPRRDVTARTRLVLEDR